MTHNPSTRLHGLDALRGSALLLGIFFHASLSFTPGDMYWFIVDQERSSLIYGAGFWSHMFRMSLFFLLAGYFARMQTHRLGTGRFIRDRLKRIGAPLLIFWLPLMIAFIAVGMWGTMVANGGTLPEGPPPPPPTLETFPLTHLWFLYMLLLFYAGALILRVVTSILKIGEPIGRLSDTALRALSGYGLLPALFGVIIGTTLINQAGWFPAGGIRTPDTGFIPNSGALVSYAIAFGFGWMLQREEKLLARVTRHWVTYFAIATGLTAYCLSVIGLQIQFTQAIDPQTKTLFAIAYGMGIWFWTLGLTGLCMKIWAKESPVRRYIADSSYWLYIIHLPLVIALQVWVSQWALMAELKFLIILGVSIPLMLLTYELLVRYTFLGSLLNGRKRVRQKTAKILEPAE
ncbi:MAG: acyltransferase family protein [Pseudomonadota bacterium]